MVKGKVAVITGAGSGIGRAAALGLLAEGFTVVLAGRREDRLQETARLCGTGDAHVMVQPTDVREPAQVTRLFDRTADTYGRIDLLFNNAGLFTRGLPIDELPVADWLNAVATNLTGPFLRAREAFRHMKRQRPMGGRIINNGSVSASAPRPNSAPYTATKHAMTGLTKSLSLDGRAFAIAAGQIDIGNVGTDLADFAKPLPQANEPSMDMPDVVRAIVYMATLPPGANVQFMTVMATAMPLVGRG